MSDAEVRSARRFYLLKAQHHDDLGEWGLADAFRAKQKEQLSVALPPTFPLRTELVAAEYSTKADVDGADVAELRTRVRLTRAQAEAVISAIATIV